jgi:hypothetical protein
MQVLFKEIKMIPLEIKSIVQTLQDAELVRRESQEALQKYVNSKQFPLEERFNIWEKWCDKKHHPWIIHEQTVPVIGKWIDDHKRDDCFNRYSQYDWNYFLEAMSSDEYMSEVEVQELLIATNFGSFIFDW